MEKRLSNVLYMSQQIKFGAQISSREDIQIVQKYKKFDAPFLTPIILCFQPRTEFNFFEAVKKYFTIVL